MNFKPIRQYPDGSAVYQDRYGETRFCRAGVAPELGIESNSVISDLRNTDMVMCADLEWLRREKELQAQAVIKYEAEKAEADKLLTDEEREEIRKTLREGFCSANRGTLWE